MGGPGADERGESADDLAQTRHMYGAEATPPPTDYGHTTEPQPGDDRYRTPPYPGRGATGPGRSTGSGGTHRLPRTAPGSRGGAGGGGGRRPAPGTRAGTGTGTGTGRSRIGEPLVLPLTPGQLVDDGRYRLVERLGRGGYGEVWKAIHIELDNPRAIKVLFPQLSAHDDFLARFRREAKLMTKLDDPHSVRVYDYVAGATPYIVMEYVAGQTLRTLLRPVPTPADPTPALGRTLPLDLVARLLFQLCCVLEKARDLGLVHRDLKPENLMLVSGRPVGAEELKVLDFGIAKIVVGDAAAADSAQTMHTAATSGPICTPLYASPEQAFSEPLDHRSDLYTVGVILYELLCGRAPFVPDGDTPNWQFVTLMRQRSEVPEPPSKVNPAASIPPGVEAVVLRCLAKKPGDRYQTPTALWEAFYAAAARAVPPHRLLPAGGTGIHTPVGTIKDPNEGIGSRPGPNRRRRAVVAGALGLLLAGALGVGVYRSLPETKNEDQPPPPPPPDVLNPIVERLRKEGYEAVQDSGDFGGWPGLIEDTSQKYQLRCLAPGRYIPAGYDRHRDAETTSEGLPERIQRVGPGGAALPKEESAVFHWIPGGTFTMGEDEGGEDRPWSPAHRVTLGGFYLQETEVTNAEIEAFFERDADASMKRALEDWETAFRDELRKRVNAQEQRAGERIARSPAVNIKWKTAADYARSRGALLPTEAQWEYAARSGPASHGGPFVWPGKDWGEGKAHVAALELDPLAPVEDFPDDRTAQGIRGMAGNASEWCRDAFEAYRAGEQTNPVVVSPDPPHVVRGGSYLSLAQDQCRVYFRREGESRGKSNEKWVEASPEIGFRLVVELKEFPAP